MTSTAVTVGGSGGCGDPPPRVGGILSFGWVWGRSREFASSALSPGAQAGKGHLEGQEGATSSPGDSQSTRPMWQRGPALTSLPISPAETDPGLPPGSDFARPGGGSEYTHSKERGLLSVPLQPELGPSAADTHGAHACTHRQVWLEASPGSGVFQRGPAYLNSLDSCSFNCLHFQGTLLG